MRLRGFMSRGTDVTGYQARDEERGGLGAALFVEENPGLPDFRGRGLGIEMTGVSGKGSRSGSFERFGRHAGSRRRVRGSRAVLLAGLLCLGAGPAFARSDLVGEVDTAFRWLGKDDRVVVEAYDDPKVAGVTCYVSRARTGGFKGTVGVAEDKTEASIACRQVGPISFGDQVLPKQEDVFSERMSLLFKRLHVVRMVDAPRNTLVYLTYSDKLIDGSPANSVTAVPVGRELPIPVR